MTDRGAIPNFSNTLIKFCNLFLKIDLKFARLNYCNCIDFFDYLVLKAF